MSGLDARTAVAATGWLADLNAAGVLHAADVHVATRLGRLGGEQDPVVLLAAALAVRALRHGSVCVWPAQERPVPLDEDTTTATTPTGAQAEAPDLPWPQPQDWEPALRASTLVAVGPDGPADRPLRWVQGRLYLDRYWRQEQVVRHELRARAGDPPAAVDPDRLAQVVDRVLGDLPGDRRATHLQRLAPAVAACSWVTVLTGGPGTGKTTTVARLVAALAHVTHDTAQPATGQAPTPPGHPGGPRPMRVALAAPTGRAAARLQEAVQAELDAMPADVRARVGPLSASTVHRLLGWRPDSSTRFRHDRDNRLPHDLVVVDETSMVSLTLMSRLLEALRPHTRLVLVGDPDQLASVEAGAVLGDLVARRPEDDHLLDRVRASAPDLLAAAGLEAGPDLGQEVARGVVRLRAPHRYDEHGGVHELAEAIRVGDPDRALAALDDGSGVELWAAGPDEPPHADGVRAVRAQVLAAGTRLVTAARDGDVAAALTALEQHRLLLAHRRGPHGVAAWSDLVQQWLAAEGLGPDGNDPWYPGRPLLVTANDRDTGLHNGDTGVVVRHGQGVVAVFGTATTPLKVPPHRLGAVQTVHAMTVHRGQGSQFRQVSLVLPGPQSPLLTRELLYTAITRARDTVRVIGSREAVRAAVTRPVRRASGLRS